MQLPEHSIISELDDAVNSGSTEKRLKALRQVTALFLRDMERLSDEQIRVFDDVFCLLVVKVETRARAELSRRLAPIDRAPIAIIQRLALDDAIAVAGDVLVLSRQLATDTLIEIANTKGQEHLLALSGRANLPEAVTDAIVTRGEQRVIHRLAHNATASFSDSGYAGMAVHAESDDELSEVLALRPDLPLSVLTELLRRATDEVRERLTAKAAPELKAEIGRVLKDISGAAAEPTPETRDFSRAEDVVKRMKAAGELSEPALLTFTQTSRFDEVAAALGVLNTMPTMMMAQVIEGTRHDLVLIPCKSAGLSWMTVEAILLRRPIKFAINSATLNAARQDYNKLSVETAQRALRFWQLHNKVGKQL
jgi:uncharacterized protein (DUF2336 family)